MSKGLSFFPGIVRGIALALTVLAFTACNKDNNNSQTDPDPGPDIKPAAGLFSSCLQKTDEEIQDKLDELWNHYFKGDNNSKVYYDNGSEAYILDVSENVVRSQGMGFGLMICVQTDHKSEFDKLWNYVKNYMWRKSGEWDGYFASSCDIGGSIREAYPCPGAEMYITASLLLASRCWNEPGYMESAQYILERMWGKVHSLFNPNHCIITYVPSGSEANFTSPSYDLPAFIELFAKWSETNTEKWATALSATRTHLYRSSNKQSGLFSDINNFDGTPHGVSYNTTAEKYMYYAMLCAMNIGMDYYLFHADDARQTELAKRIIDFFEKDGYTHARFNWDGSNPQESYTLGEKGCNAVICYALADLDGYENVVEKNLNLAWDASLSTGKYRYHDGLIHYLAMLHLCGRFQIWDDSE
jgi:endo-1,4-beta-D-glucanase Y